MILTLEYRKYSTNELLDILKNETVVFIDENYDNTKLLIDLEIREKYCLSSYGNTLYFSYYTDDITGRPIYTIQDSTPHYEGGSEMFFISVDFSGFLNRVKEIIDYRIEHPKANNS